MSIVYHKKVENNCFKVFYTKRRRLSASFSGMREAAGGIAVPRRRKRCHAASAVLFDRGKAGRFQPVFPCGCLFSADGRRNMRKCSFSPVPHLHKGSSAVFVKVQNF
ncbi:MAG TPA: hypothetical protein DE060_07645 [Lentisphaeria bacterium]|nr:hypothetical protein [Lentisphaeria bacterium]HCG49063.1 hypothetical protein [Lentisphaeria bacterium]